MTVWEDWVGVRYDLGVMWQEGHQSNSNTSSIVNVCVCVCVHALHGESEGPPSPHNQEVMRTKFNVVSSDSDCGWAGVCVCVCV